MVEMLLTFVNLRVSNRLKNLVALDGIQAHSSASCCANSKTLSVVMFDFPR